MERTDWTVLLIGGSSGVGKTNLGRQLALHYGIPLVHADDIRMAVQSVTTPAQHPALHRLRSPSAPDLSPEEVRDAWIEIGGILSQAWEVVIASHALTGLPIILEGDGLLPALAAQPVLAGHAVGHRVRSIFLVSSDALQLKNDLGARERDGHNAAELLWYAHSSWLYNQWLQEEAVKHGLPVIVADRRQDLAKLVLQLVGSAAVSLGNPPADRQVA